MNTVQPTPTGRHNYNPPEALRVRSLSARETEVMRLICDGIPRKQICTVLRVSPHTIEKHINNLYSKWNVHTAVEVLRFAILNGHYELQRWEGNPS